MNVSFGVERIGSNDPNPPYTFLQSSRMPKYRFWGFASTKQPFVVSGSRPDTVRHNKNANVSIYLQAWRRVWFGLVILRITPIANDALHAVQYICGPNSDCCLLVVDAAHNTENANDSSNLNKLGLILS